MSAFAELPQFGPFALEDPKILVSTLIGLVLLGLLLYFVNVPVFSWPYLNGVLSARSARIEEHHRQVETALTDVRSLHNDYATRLQRIEVEARERIDSAVREADAARTEIIAEAQLSATALRRRAEEELARERTRSRILLRQQIVKTSLDAAEQAVRANSTDAVQRHLIRDFTLLAAHDKNGATAVVSVPRTTAPTSIQSEEA